MKVFGALERLLSEDLYPYRIPLTLGVLAVLIVAGVLLWRSGRLSRVVAVARRRPGPAALVGLATIALLVPLGDYLVAPLWKRSALEEVSPLDAAYWDFQPRAVLERDPKAPPPPVPAVPPAAGSTTSARVISRGEWKGADDFHFARGRALIVEAAPGEYVLRLEGFSVRNGPDLFVLLSPTTDGARDGALKLGRLKATDGSFNYEIPLGTDIEAFKSAMVWCEQFAVLFGTAPLAKG
ncbi:MAG: hypothetical protein EPO65_02090 [Dehalococcoidia bacterium]|nr:MAG: hypothetical protein EPO65_02090 [Dehalococcoidia bacterium]